MHSFYRDPARRPMVMSSGAVACLAAPEMALPEGVDGLQVCSVRIVPSAPGRRCPPTYCQELGAVHLLAPCWCAPTFLAQVLVRLAGSRPPGRVSLGMESAGRAQPVRSGARARRRNPARLAVEAAAHRAPFRRSGKELKHAHMHTCIQKATQHVTSRDKTQTRGHAAMS